MPRTVVASAQTVAWLAMAMIGSFALPGPAQGGQQVEDRAADAVVRGPLGASLDDYPTRGSR
jgi:hypothetical protein